MRKAVFNATTGELLNIASEETLEFYLDEETDYVDVADDLDESMFVWSPDARQYVIDVGKAREVRWSIARAYRDEQMTSGCSTPFGRVQTDVASQTKIGGAVTGALVANSLGQGAGYYVDWTMSDNSVANLHANDIIQMGMIVLAHISACQNRGTQIRAEIQDAETIEAIEAVDFTAGYPASS